MSRAERRPGRPGFALLVAFLAAAGAGCRQDMHDQAKVEPLETSEFYADGRASREPVAGTVARGQLHEDLLRQTGKVGGQPVEEYPYPVTRALLDRGAERYNIFCSPCHDRMGTGNGIVVQRGFPKAASFHAKRLREAKTGYIFEVIGNGFGRMAGYGAQIPVDDRWAIVAWVRTLQVSQAATLEDVPEPERSRLLQEKADR